ncbi:MAG: B12-binding domain-containing radical SAM protein [Deltaproteobacteria bacterium]|nr:B12-binding domain-containing radical SAM protein [Deltaproteobacteria bacterium]
MARVVFVQDIHYEQIGIMSLSAYLRQAGHKTSLVIGTGKRVAKAVIKEKPDLVALSVMSYQRAWAKNLVQELKRLGLRAPILGGGIHLTQNPDDYALLGLDSICRGEGEEALLEAVQVIGNGHGLESVANFSGPGFSNAPRPLMQNLDDLPFLDRSIYERYLFFRVTRVRQVMASRGCPFSCPYCHNVHVRRLYPKGTRWVRMYSPGRVVEELEAVKKDYSPAIFRFQDDLFGMDVHWLHEFLELYRRRAVGVSFQVQTRADTLDEAMVKELADAGCVTVTVGLETGDEGLRNKVLGKGVADETYLKLAQACKRYGLGFTTNNMFGLPGEGVDQAIKTVSFNARLKTARMDNDIFKPYRGLDLTKKAILDGLLKEGDLDRLDESAFKMRRSILRHPEIHRVENVHKLSILGARVPALIPLLRHLSRVPPNPVFDGLFLLTAFTEYLRNDLWINPVETLLRLVLNIRAVL